MKKKEKIMEEERKKSWTRKVIIWRRRSNNTKNAVIQYKSEEIQNQPGKFWNLWKNNRDIMSLFIVCIKASIWRIFFSPFYPFNYKCFYYSFDNNFVTQLQCMNSRRILTLPLRFSNHSIFDSKIFIILINFMNGGRIIFIGMIIN